MADIDWTPEQRSKIDEAIAAEIENSRLAHKLIPEYQLSPNDRAVSADRYNYATGDIDETHVALQEAIEPFFLTKLQCEDQDLSGALMKARRAAQQLARRHDDQVFRISIRNQIDGGVGTPGFNQIVNVNQPYPDDLVRAVALAVAALDGQGHRTGYVMVAGHDVYTQLHSRGGGAADLPVKAIQGLLEGGTIHRSAVLAPTEALVLSLSGEEIDRAVAVPATLEFLRIGQNELREFRVFERFLPRFKLTYSAVLLRLVPPVAAKDH
jgi:uncharacterized linocin/CFP29 family protein